MGSKGTIGIGTGTGKKHVNKDNVAFILTKGVNHKSILFILLGSLLAVSIVVGYLSEWFLAVPGIILAVVVYSQVVESSEFLLGTLTDSIRITGGHSIADDLSKGYRKTLSVEGIEETSFKRYAYRHLFVVDHIVSIERKDPGISGTTLLATIVFAILGFVIIQDYTAASFLFFGAAGVVVYLNLDKPSTVIITLKSGDEKQFVMDDQDASQLVGEFQDKLS